MTTDTITPTAVSHRLPGLSAISLTFLATSSIVRSVEDCRSVSFATLIVRFFSSLCIFSRFLSLSSKLCMVAFSAATISLTFSNLHHPFEFSSSAIASTIITIPMRTPEANNPNPAHQGSILSPSFVSHVYERYCSLLWITLS